MVPAKVLALWVAPSPEKSLADLLPTDSLASCAAERIGKADTLPEPEVVRFAVLDDTWLAVTRSTIWMVTVSPMERARTSSKDGR